MINQERTTRFSFSGSPSVIERLGIEMAGAAVSYFMSSDLPEGALAPINPDRHREWATNPDDHVMAASLKVGGEHPFEYQKRIRELEAEIATLKHASRRKAA